MKVKIRLLLKPVHLMPRQKVKNILLPAEKVKYTSSLTKQSGVTGHR